MVVPNNLPQQLTTFVGRENEIAEVKRLLDTGRLLTLTGAGGAGKTRLALEVAYRLLDAEQYPDGIWLVELQAIRDPELIPQAVISALNLREEIERDLFATILDHLRTHRLLLLIDNCEHLVDAVASIVNGLLRSAPTLRVLATGRQPLGLDGEMAWRVPSLEVPPIDGKPSFETIAGCESIRLFDERARLRQPEFTLTSKNALAVAEICRHLDGLPLAIELAAARTRVLSVEQILERLDERFRLLASPSEMTIPRHRTLRALMDWSYGLLTDEEQALLRRLSVFAGTFTLDAVEEICAGQGDDIETLDRLSQLADKSLVVVDVQPTATGQMEARYHLLDTIRQYAGQKLAASGEESDLRDRHLHWYLELSEHSEDVLLSERQNVALERLEREHDNLRAALAWSLHDVEGGELPAECSDFRVLHALRLVASLTWFWYFRGYLREGRTWIDKAIAYVDCAGKTAVAGKALSAAGVLAFLQSDLDPAKERLERALAIWRELQDPRGIGFALTFLGRVVAEKGEDSGAGMAEEGEAIFEQIGEKWGLALSYDFLGEVARDRGDEKAATELHDRSLALYREMGHRWGVALELSNFGQVAIRRGDYAGARQRLEEAVAIQREVGDKSALGWALRSLAEVVRHTGDRQKADELLAESRELFRELGRRDAEQATAPPPEQPAAGQAEETNEEGLTRREVEVLKLIAQGLSDAQIADGLCLSIRTVQAHVRSIYVKINVMNRSAATRWALERKLT